MRYRGPLSPDQAAAFWRLDFLTGDDVSRLAMQWLEEDATSPTVASLAGQRDLRLVDCREDFEKCLRELGADAPSSKREAIWRVVRTLLIAVKEGTLDALDGAHEIVTLEREGLDLFPLRNLASDGKPYAGEELGIELIVGLYWTLDDVDSTDAEVVEATAALKAECVRVLEVFYTNPPKDLDRP